MDDDRKKFTRKGAKPGGPRRQGEGKPAFAGKSRAPGKKSYARRDEGPSGEGREAGAQNPFRKGPPRGDRPFAKREKEEGRKPFVKRAGDRKPFVRREKDGEGPQRDFERRDRPAAEGAPREGQRSFGPKRHEGKRHEGKRHEDKRYGDGRRSHGMKNHAAGDKKPFRKAAEAVEDAAGERIAKRLARAGIASRRDAEELIAAGRVSVNGRKLDSPAFNVMPDDRIEVDGTPIPAIERTRLFLFHKPAGVVTTNRDPEGRKTVFEVLPADLPRLMTVGRLDINTEGLLLLTNDGGLARVLELPATGWLRRYRARVHGKVDEKALAGLKDGIAVDGVFYGSVEASLDREQGSNAWLTIGLREGKNREVKNILGALGLDVSRLIRISYGPFQLGDLPEGHVLEIKGRMLRDQLGERLIEEAGANFEAPIVTHFPNQPVKRGPERKDETAARPKVRRDGERGRIGEGGLIKKRHRRELARDEALGKLSTRPDRGGKFGDRPASRPPRGEKAEREQRAGAPAGPRKSNVWMAPGARPQGKGRLEAERAEVEAKKNAKGKHRPGPHEGRARGFSPRGDGPRGPRGKGRR